jgi:hypothetical protein
MASKTMTPSESISAGQIGQIQDRLGTALRQSGLPNASTQDVLKTKGEGDQMIAEMVGVVRKFVEAKASEVVRRVKVNRTQTPMQAIDATGRNKYVDEQVVATMPAGEGEEVDVVFFKPRPDEYTRPGFMSDDDLERALDRRGLKSDPRAQAKANEEDPAFADERPNGTHWKDVNGKWCFATFNRWLDRRRVHVNRFDDDWNDYWWFAGVRK